jgi:TolA-binding protein
MDRQHRQDLKHDKFVDEIGTLSTRARENQRLLVTITAAAVAIAVIAYGIVFYRSNREVKAQAALSAAIDTMDSPLLPSTPPQPGEQPPVGAKYRTEAERNGVAEKQFRTVQSSYSGTDAADVAKLYLARLDAARGDVASARTLLQQFVSDHPKHILVGTARYSLYQLRIDNGEATQVVNELNAELNKSEPILPSDTLLIVLAHAYSSQGNEAKSRDMYKRIATEFPDSPYALEAQRRMGPA